MSLVNITDNATLIDFVVKIKATSTTFTTPTQITKGSIVYPFQPKTFIGNDGYYYIFFSNPSYDPYGNNIVYISSQDGINWSGQTTVTNTGDINDGSQFAVWYDDSTNTIALVRVFYNSTPPYYQSNLYYSIGIPSNGVISWNVLDTAQATTYLASLPSVYINNSSLWVSLLTYDEDSNKHNEVWLYDLNTTTWSQVKIDDVLDYGAFIVGVSGGIILMRGWTGLVTIYQTTDNGATWSAGVTTTNNYLLYQTGYTTWGDTVYFGSINDTVNQFVTVFSYELGGTLIEPVSLLYGYFGTGMTINVNGVGFIFGGVSVVNFYQSLPFGELDVNNMNFMPPVQIYNLDETSPSNVQMYYKLTGSPARTIAIWKDAYGNLWTSIITPTTPLFYKDITDYATATDSIVAGLVKFITDSATVSENLKVFRGHVFVTDVAQVFDNISVCKPVFGFGGITGVYGAAHAKGNVGAIGVGVLAPFRGTIETIIVKLYDSNNY